MANMVAAVLKSFPTITRNYFSWILKNSKNPRKTPLSIKYKKLRNMVTTINRNLKLDFHVFGLENADTETCACYFPNHLSGYDPIAVLMNVKRPTTFMSKVENKKIPIIGRVISAMEGLFINRGDLKELLNAMNTVEKDLISQNKNWIVFPEGTRNKNPDEDMGEFHRGIFRSAMKAKAPIVPTVLFGTQHALKNDLKMRKYPIFISYLKPLLPEEYSALSVDEVCLKCREMMSEELVSLREKYYKEIQHLIIKKK